MADVPSYMRSTVAMLRSAFPDGISSDELVVLMGVLGDEGMSNRSVASALGLVLGQGYMVLLHDVATCELDPRVTGDANARMRERLRAHGYDAWAREDDS